MARNPISLKLQSLLLVILLCTLSIPVSANDINESPSIDITQESLNQPQYTNPTKLVKTTDGKLFLIISESKEIPEYFNWINDEDTYKLIEDVEGNPRVIIHIPDDKKPANASPCWPFKCVEATLPIAVGGVMVAAEAIELITSAATITTAAAITLQTIDTAKAFKFSGNIYEKGCSEFNQLAQFLEMYTKEQLLNKYTFYTVNDDAFNELGEHTYHDIDRKKHIKDKLTTEEAIDKMKDCKPKQSPDNPKKIDQKKVIRIFSTEEGCKKITEYVTKLLGGKKIEYESSKGGKLAHYHPGLPLDTDGTYRHCNSHCYFKEPPHMEL